MTQVLTLTDPEFGLAVTVTQTKKGFAVTFIDTDSENIIGVRIYPEKLRALAYAHGLIPNQLAKTEELTQ